MSSLGTVYLDVKFNSAQVGSELKKSTTGAAGEAASAIGSGISERLGSISTSLTRAGRQMTVGLTIPLVAAGKAATNAFLPFEENLAKIQGLTGANEKDMALYKSTILNTSASFGVMASDAADALYFITSSGIQGTAAINTLNASMQASAAGLGDVATVADFATSVMNAYGQENISAAKATDILTVAVRDGKAEPEELAASIGQVIPIAAQLGVSADQVAGSMAAITLNGTSAASASAQMTQVLTSLLGPSEEAKNVLSNIGLSASELSDSLKNNGLLPTIERITTGLQGNTEALDKVFGNVRALRGVLGLVGTEQAMKRTKQILDDTKDSAGATAKAFDVMSQTSGFKLKQALADVNTSLVDIGADIVPLGSALLNVANVGVKAFGSLPEPLQQTATGILAVGAAAGPLTYIFGGITKAADGIGKGLSFITDTRIKLLAGSSSGAGRGMELLNSSTVKAAAGFGVFAVAVVGASVVLNTFNSRVEEAGKAADDFFAKLEGKNIKKGPGAFAGLQQQVKDANKAIDAARGDFEDALGGGDPNKAPGQLLFGGGLAQQKQAEANVDAAQKSGTAAAKLSGQALAIAKAYGISNDEAATYLLTQKELGSEFDNSEQAVASYGSALGQANSQTKASVTSLGSLINVSKNASDSFFGLVSAQRSLEDAQLKVVTSQRAQETAQRGLIQANRDVAAAQRSVQAAERARAESALKTKDAIEAQRDAQQNLNDLLNGNAGKSDALDVSDAQIALDDARRELRTFKADKDDPNGRQKAVNSVARAEIALARAQEAHQKNIVAAQKDVRDANKSVEDALQEQKDSTQAVIDAQQGYEDATYRSRDAQLAVEQSVRDTQRAQEDLTGVAATLAEKQEAFVGAISGANGQAGPFLDFLKALKETYPELSGAIDGTIAKFQGVADAAAKSRRPDLTGARPGAVNAERRAFGGSAVAGGFYRYNEPGAGPGEMFTDSFGNNYLAPTKSGQFRSFSEWSGDVKGGDGGVRTGDIIVQGAAQPVKTAYEIRRKIRSKGFITGGKK